MLPDGLSYDKGKKHMSNISKSILMSLSALAIACSSPASAQFGGFGGMGMMGMGGFPGMGMGGFGGMGMGGMGMGGMGMGGMGMAGMAINALAAAAQQKQYGGYGYRRARYRASQQRRYIYPQDQFGAGYYGYPQAPYTQGYPATQSQYSVSPLKTTHSRKSRRCYQQEWDAAEGYVNVAGPCR